MAIIEKKFPPRLRKGSKPDINVPEIESPGSQAVDPKKAISLDRLYNSTFNIINDLEYLLE
jgi:hypothetical protein